MRDILFMLIIIIIDALETISVGYFFTKTVVGLPLEDTWRDLFPQLKFGCPHFV